MQTKGNQRIIVVVGTDKPPIDDLYAQVAELREGWRIASATTTAETVSTRLKLAGRVYRRYMITAALERAA